MKQENIVFFINKYAYKTDDSFDSSVLPIRMRGKLSSLDKIAFSLLKECYNNEDVALVFASQYGEFDRLKELVNQYNNEKEVSPSMFSASVHNYIAGLFSILNKIHKPYNSLSAGKNTLSMGLLDSILNKDDVLFCYADDFDNKQGAACLITKTKGENSIKVVFNNDASDDIIEDEFSAFVSFLKNDKCEFKTSLYTLTRCD